MPLFRRSLFRLSIPAPYRPTPPTMLLKAVSPSDRPSVCHAGILSERLTRHNFASPIAYHISFLSASLYFSKRGAYWDRLCRDVVGRWLVGWLVGCHARALWPNGASCGSYYGTLIGNPTPGIQWYNFRPPGVTPNRGMGPPWGAFCQITLTSCFTVG